jgi:hypothetical protein
MSLSQILAVSCVQHLSSQEDMVTAMITNAGARVRNDIFMVLGFTKQRNTTTYFCVTQTH